MIIKTEYIEILQKISNDKTVYDNLLYYEIYSVFDLLLSDLLAGYLLKFTTIRSRFLFLADRDKYSDDLIKLSSQVFNKYHNLSENDNKLREFDIKLLAFVFIKTINYYLEEKIDFTDKTFVKLISDYTFKKEQNNQEKLDCWFKSIRRVRDKKNVVLYELKGIDDNGDDIRFLFQETILLNSQNTFAILFNLTTNDTDRCFSCLKRLFKIGRHVRFFNVSYSDKGFFYQNFESSFVIEPDFLVDTTSIAECFQTRDIIPELFFLKFVDLPSYGLPVLKGNFVNFLLDMLITDSVPNLNEDDKENDFYKQIKSQFLKILRFEKYELHNLLLEIKNIHLPNLYKLKKELLKHSKTSNISLEPSFISSEYGLQGRLDALIEYSNDKNQKTIFELKSGKPPRAHLWQNNYAQVTAYNLLLKSVFGNQRTGNSMLLYSKAEEDALRNVPFSQNTANQILLCRNIIVNQILNFCDNDNCILTILQKLSKYHIPPFLKNTLTESLILFNQLRDFEILYINNMLSFVMRELTAQKLSFIDDSGIVRYGHSGLWLHNYEEKCKQKIIISNLKLINSNDKIFEFIIDKSDINSTITNTGGFREGDLILLYPALLNHALPAKVQLFKAVLKETLTDENENLRIFVTFRNEQIRFKDLSHFNSFFIEKDILESGYYSTPSGIINFFKKKIQERDIYFGLKKPRINRTVNKAELENMPVFDRIMSKASNFKDYLLIQGPPGTGKTSKYLMSIVKNHLNLNKTSIVIVAFTNRAVEEICNKLSDNEIDFLLLGTKLTEERFHINSLINLEFNEIKETLSSKSVFVSTVATFQNEAYFLKDYIDTDLLIVDEASQLLESQLIGVIGLFKRFILIGDHYQLPAVAVQPETEVQKTLKEKINLNSLKDSLFERLYNTCLKKGWTEFYDLLPEHYRMHHQIASLINPFYDNKLKSNHSRQFEDFRFYQDSDNDNLITNIKQARCLFINTSECLNIRFNIEEADKILSIVKAIYENKSSDFNDETIGIICTWRMQVNTVTERLQNLPYSKQITVDTVERFQGSERDIIIYSTAVSNPDLLKRMQSVNIDNKIDRKLIVAISRAKEQFIMLGNKKLLFLSKHYKQVIENLTEVSI